MRTELNGKLYDTTDSVDIALDTLPTGDNHLYQTKQGEFFLLLQQSYLDGRKLGPEEDLYELAPDLFVRGAGEERSRRTKAPGHPTDHEQRSGVWCVKPVLKTVSRALPLDILLNWKSARHH
jgi:hypothetical protein